MKVNICQKEYNIDSLDYKTDKILDILFAIKEQKDTTLAFRSGCKSGVCGSCAIRVNGIEKLACKTDINDEDIIEPLKNHKTIKDLVVDLIDQQDLLKKTKSYLEKNSNEQITQNDQEKIDKESNCILCNSCYSSCPIFEVNKNFLGPFALTRTYRYVNEKKESSQKNKIDVVQENGIWDCTLCGNCNMVCPAGIDIKNDIIQLRNKSAQFGYTDPKFSSFDNSFNQDFGFDPNSF